MNVYFDNSATTKPYDEVIEAVSKGMKEYFGNPSSLHKIGMNCEKRLNEAREYFASTIKCNKEEGNAFIPVLGPSSKLPVFIRI